MKESLVLSRTTDGMKIEITLPDKCPMVCTLDLFWGTAKDPRKIKIAHIYLDQRTRVTTTVEEVEVLRAIRRGDSHVTAAVDDQEISSEIPLVQKKSIIWRVLSAGTRVKKLAKDGMAGLRVRLSTIRTDASNFGLWMKKFFAGLGANARNEGAIGKILLILILAAATLSGAIMKMTYLWTLTLWLTIMAAQLHAHAGDEKFRWASVLMPMRATLWLGLWLAFYLTR